MTVGHTFDHSGSSLLTLMPRSKARAQNTIFKFYSTVYSLKQKNAKILRPTSFRVHTHFNQQISHDFVVSMTIHDL